MPASRRSARRARARAAAPRPCRRPASSSGWTTPCSAAARQPRPPVAEVVRVRAGQNGCIARAARRARRGGRRAPSCSGSSGRDRSRRYPSRSSSAVVIISCRMPIARGDVARAVELAGRERRRDRRHRERALAERARRERGDERRVDPARERDDAAPERADPCLELLDRRHGSWARASASAQTDFTERPVDLRKRGAVVVLGRDVDDAAVEEADLDAHACRRRPRRHAPRARARSDRAATTRTPSALVSSSRARAISPCASGRASDGEDEARAALLHLRRHGPDVERARREAALDRIRDELGRRGRRGSSRAGRPRPVGSHGLRAEHDAHDVRPVGEVLRPRAVADALERERRQARPTPRRPSPRSPRRSASRARPPCRRRRAARPRAAPSVAGAGSGSTPCAAVTKPRANGSGEEATRSTPRSSSRTNAPQTSTSVSSGAELVEVDVVGRARRGSRLRPRRAARTPRVTARARGREGRPPRRASRISR